MRVGLRRFPRICLEQFLLGDLGRVRPLAAVHLVRGEPAGMHVTDPGLAGLRLTPAPPASCSASNGGSLRKKIAEFTPGFWYSNAHKRLYRCTRRLSQSRSCFLQAFCLSRVASVGLWGPRDGAGQNASIRCGPPLPLPFRSTRHTEQPVPNCPWLHAAHASCRSAPRPALHGSAVPANGTGSVSVGPGLWQLPASGSHCPGRWAGAFGRPSRADTPPLFARSMLLAARVARPRGCGWIDALS